VDDIVFMGDTVSGDDTAAQVDGEAHIDAVTDTSPTGRLGVTTIPLGAHVWVDGTMVGIAPMGVDLAPGVYKVNATLPGLAVLGGPVDAEIVAGEKTRLDFRLQPALEGSWHAYQCYWDSFTNTCWKRSAANAPASISVITNTPGICTDVDFAYDLTVERVLDYSNPASPGQTPNFHARLCLGSNRITLGGDLNGSIYSENELRLRMKDSSYIRLFRVIDGCTPSCPSGVCGPDGCGGACTSCNQCDSAECGSVCGKPNCAAPSNPAALTSCVEGLCHCQAADCSVPGRCGDNGCGGSCGGCSAGATCTNFMCEGCPVDCTIGELSCSGKQVYRCDNTASGCPQEVLVETCQHSCSNGQCTGGSSGGTCGSLSGPCPGSFERACAGTCGYRCDFDGGYYSWEKLGDCRQYGSDCTCIMYSGTLPMCAHGGNPNNLCSTSW